MDGILFCNFNIVFMVFVEFEQQVNCEEIGFCYVVFNCDFESYVFFVCCGGCNLIFFDFVILVYCKVENGMVIVIVFGFLGNLIYVWSDGQMMVMVIGFVVGYYIVIVIDVNGCMEIFDVDVLFVIIVVMIIVVLDVNLVCVGQVVNVLFSGFNMYMVNDGINSFVIGN